MINRVLITAEIEPDSFKKEVRTRLMTGGAFLKLEEGLSAEQVTALYERFAPEATGYNISGNVLRELLSSPNISDSLKEKIEGRLHGR